MAYLGTIFSHVVSDAEEVKWIFQKGKVLRGKKKAAKRSSKEGVSISKPFPSRELCRIHLSCLIAFIDNIQFPFYIEKNNTHPDAREEIVNLTKCLGLGMEGEDRRKKKTRVFTFTVVCKGTSLCRASPCGAKSKRKNCGYGVRLYTLNEFPTDVIVEEFGRHRCDLDDVDDDGITLAPPEGEMRTRLIGPDLIALRSFARGLTPAKHLAYIGETTTLTMIDTPKVLSDLTSSSVLVDTRNAYRRFKQMTHTAVDLDGVQNILQYLTQDEEKYIVDFINLTDYSVESPLVIMVALKEICEKIDLIGSDVLGLDATFGVTSYDFALFSVMGRSNGGGIPLCYFISSSKSQWAVSMGLFMFKRAINVTILHLRSSLYGDDFALDSFQPYSPVAICIDKDDAERGAIADVFPNALVVLCHYHAMVLFIDEARALRHNLSLEEVGKLMDVMRKLCVTTTVEEFGRTLQRVREISNSFYDYVSKNFLNDRWIDTFSEVNRQHLSPSAIRVCRSNMLVEVSFKTLKYVLLGGMHNKRLDDLIYTLVFKAFPYFMIRYNGVRMYKPRFITTRSSLLHGTLLHRSKYIHHQ